MRKFTEKELVIASHNTGKIREIGELLVPYDVHVSGGTEYNLPEPEETEDSFIGNARLKSEYFAAHVHKPCLADDSGLVVPALDGAPGIYSARWAGEPRDFYQAMGRVKKELEERKLKPEGQDAHFVCALALTWPDGHTEVVEGKVFGALTFPPRGEKGFGYDPIFIPEGHQLTFAEIEPEAKHRISHRANAFNQLIEHVFSKSVA